MAADRDDPSAGRPRFPRATAPARAPHPATVVQKKPAIGKPAARAPHPATVAQKKPALGPPAARAPHPATVAQKKGKPTGAAVAQRMNLVGFVDVDLMDIVPTIPVLVFTGVLDAQRVHGTSSHEDGVQKVTLTDTSYENSYYLPWKNGSCTVGKMSLKNPMFYFFTAPLSGCSIWYKYVSNSDIEILHEARTSSSVQQGHVNGGFTLVFDSNKPGDWKLSDVKLETEVTDTLYLKQAVSFVVYGAVEAGRMVFYVQEIFTKTVRDLSSKGSQVDTTYKVVDYRRIPT
jgi:hypothetical protein